METQGWSPAPDGSVELIPDNEPAYLLEELHNGILCSQPNAHAIDEYYANPFVHFPYPDATLRILSEFVETVKDIKPRL